MPQTSKEGKTAPVLKPAEAKTLVGHCECLLRNVPYKIHPHRQYTGALNQEQSAHSHSGKNNHTNRLQHWGSEHAVYATPTLPETRRNSSMSVSRHQGGSFLNRVRAPVPVTALHSDGMSSSTTPRRSQAQRERTIENNIRTTVTSAQWKEKSIWGKVYSRCRHLS